MRFSQDPPERARGESTIFRAAAAYRLANVSLL